MTPRAARLAPDARRSVLLDAAVGEFARRPYGDVSMADIARAAGVSKPLLFRYFDDKRALYLASVRASMQMLDRASDPDPELAPADRFALGLNGMLDLLERFPNALPSLEFGEIAADAEVQALVDDGSERIASRIIARMGIDRPTPRLRHAVRSWFAFVRASTHDWLVRRAVSRAELVELQIATFGAAVEQALGLASGALSRRGCPPYLR